MSHHSVQGEDGHGKWRLMMLQQESRSLTLRYFSSMLACILPLMELLLCPGLTNSISAPWIYFSSASECSPLSTLLVEALHRVSVTAFRSLSPITHKRSKAEWCREAHTKRVRWRKGSNPLLDPAFSRLLMLYSCTRAINTIRLSPDAL